MSTEWRLILILLLLVIEFIQDLLLKHQVLFFPKQHLTVEQHVQLGKYFAQSMDGHLQGHPNLKLLGKLLMPQLR